MNLSANALLARLNTHHVFGIGLGTALTSFATIAFGPTLDAYLGAHAPGIAHAVSPYLNAAIDGAKDALPPAIIAAAFSRPPNIPDQPKVSAPAETTRATAPAAPLHAETETHYMSALTDAIKPFAGLAVAAIKTAFDAEAPQLAADLEKSAPARVTLIAAEIKASLPKNGILANAESAVIDKAIDAGAAAIDSALPAGVTYVEGLVDNELSMLEKSLGG